MYEQECNECNDIVMKAHQNRNMNYDEMHEYSMELRNLREASYCYYVNTIYCLLAHMSVMLASRLFTYHLGVASLPPTVGVKPTGPACQP